MNKNILAIMVIMIFAGCATPGKVTIGSTDYLKLNSDDASIRKEERIVYYNELVFTGTITEVSRGDTVSITEYKNGLKHGKQLSHYSIGKVKEERYFENGLKTGEHKGWWENGKLKFIYHFSNDEFDGNVKAWSESGQLFNDFNYVNGKEEGLQRAWFPGGEIQANYVAKNYRKYGITGVKNCQTNESALSGIQMEK